MSKYRDYGPGDEATWGACEGHPNDPRTPEGPIGRPFRYRPDPMPAIEIDPPEEDDERYMATRKGCSALDYPVGYGATAKAAEENLIDKEDAYYDE